MFLKRRIATGTFVNNLRAGGRGKKKNSRSVLAGLMLTPMVDMFSLLVIFLLQNFSASPDLLYVSKGVTLPVAVSGAEMEDAPVLSIATDGVYFDQKFVGETGEVLTRPDDLMGRLQDHRELWEKTHPNQDFPGKVTIQAHTEVPSTTVSTLMGMVQSQAYATMQLAVVAGSSLGGGKVQ
ncbi:biopolymer transporter ExbD [bacterium]|jgi:biopolymer transport protein ExbD|nr:biopolymer transporter ExbD [bacterium]